MGGGIHLRNVGTLTPECRYCIDRNSGILTPEHRYKMLRNTHIMDSTINS